MRIFCRPREVNSSRSPRLVHMGETSLRQLAPPVSASCLLLAWQVRRRFAGTRFFSAALLVHANADVSGRAQECSCECRGSAAASGLRAAVVAPCPALPLARPPRWSGAPACAWFKVGKPWSCLPGRPAVRSRPATLRSTDLPRVRPHASDGFAHLSFSDAGIPIAGGFAIPCWTPFSSVSGPGAPFARGWDSPSGGLG